MKTAQDYAYYLNKPVMVQFGVPYMIPTDMGPVPVVTRLSETEEVRLTYGSPVFQQPPAGQEASAAVMCMSGMLLEDPSAPESLVFRTTPQGADGTRTTLEIALDPNNIAFVTVIPEHTPKSRLVT